MYGRLKIVLNGTIIYYVSQKIYVIQEKKKNVINKCILLGWKICVYSI